MDSTIEKPVRVPKRIPTFVVAMSVGILAALYVRAHALSQPAFTSDFDQVWAAARAWLDGRNPYLEVGPDAPFKWKWPLYYPFPALLLAAPLATLPVLAARMVFSGISTTLFVWGIGRDGWRRWPILLSITFFVSFDLVQWSLLIAAARFLPPLGGVVAGKPNFSLPLLLASRSRRDVIWCVAGAAGLLVLSLAIRPSWIGEWLANVRSAPHFEAPVMRPFGFLLLLAALKWRRPEARWLLGLSLVPMAPSFYDQLLLVVACTVWWEALVLTLGTWVLFFYVGGGGQPPDYASWGAVVGNATIWSCYLPVLLLVLRHPNVAPAGDWIGNWRATPRKVEPA